MSIKSKNNVIQFPKIQSTVPNSPEEVGQKIREYKESYSSELSEIIWENVLGEMARAGCALEEDVAPPCITGHLLSFVMIVSLV